MFTSGNVAFQAGPSAQACNWYVTQGGHDGTMQIGLGDGSVRGVNRQHVHDNMELCVRSERRATLLGSDWQ